MLDRRCAAGPALLGGLAAAPGRLRESVGLAAPAVRVDLQLLVGLVAQPLGGLGGLGARRRDESLACAARFGVESLGLGVGLSDDRARVLVCRPDDLPGRGLGACTLEQLRSLRFGVRTDQGRLLACFGERPFGRLLIGVGPAPGAVERRLGLQPRTLDHARHVGFLAGHGTLTSLQLRAFVRECLAGIRAREPPADQFEVPVDLVGVIAATDPAEAALDHEHRQRLPFGGHATQFRMGRTPVAAAEKHGIPANKDFNGDMQEGVGLAQVYQRNGRRWSNADAYLRPAATRSNLTVETGAHATRVELTGSARAASATATIADASRPRGLSAR
jgi:hypothetical protein